MPFLDTVRAHLPTYVCFVQHMESEYSDGSVLQHEIRSYEYGYVPYEKEKQGAVLYLCTYIAHNKPTDVSNPTHSYTYTHTKE